MVTFQESPDYLRGLIRKTRSLTDKPFGVGVVLAFPHKENIKAILDEKVAILLVSWGEYPNELVSEAHQAGVKVVHQVSAVYLCTSRVAFFLFIEISHGCFLINECFISSIMLVVFSLFKYFFLGRILCKYLKLLYAMFKRNLKLMI